MICRMTTATARLTDSQIRTLHTILTMGGEVNGFRGQAGLRTTSIPALIRAGLLEDIGTCSCAEHGDAHGAHSFKHRDVPGRDGHVAYHRVRATMDAWQWNAKQDSPAQPTIHPFRVGQQIHNFLLHANGVVTMVWIEPDGVPMLDWIEPETGFTGSGFCDPFMHGWVAPRCSECQRQIPQGEPCALWLTAPDALPMGRRTCQHCLDDAHTAALIMDALIDGLADEIADEIDAGTVQDEGTMSESTGESRLYLLRYGSVEMLVQYLGTDGDLIVVQPTITGQRPMHVPASMLWTLDFSTIETARTYARLALRDGYPIGRYEQLDRPCRPADVDRTYTGLIGQIGTCAIGQDGNIVTAMVIDAVEDRIRVIPLLARAEPATWVPRRNFLRIEASRFDVIAQQIIGLAAADAERSLVERYWSTPDLEF